MKTALFIACRLSPVACRLSPVLLLACVGAAQLSPHTPAASQPAPRDADALAAQYRTFVDRARTPIRAVAAAAEGAPAFRRVDLLADAPSAAPGDRLLFVDRGRSAMFVVVGKRAIADAGARLVGTHIDTPSPRLDTHHLTRTGQTQLRATRYGGFRGELWLYRPLALVGQVVARGGRAVDIELGLASDDVAFMATAASDEDITVVMSTTPTDDGKAGPAQTLVAELHRRYQLRAADLVGAELYLVPRGGAREVGLDRALVGAHGHDDRSNSFAAWRALVDVDAVPERTAIVWLTDREEVGSSGPTGATSRFLELAYAWLLAAGGAPATEATLARALAASASLSADTPACVEPNWPEVHETSAAPYLGLGPTVFPFTGSRGKDGGNAARAELTASVLASFRRAGVAVQSGELGRVDEGGGGSIAKFLSGRGIDTIDVGVCVAGMHTPFELISKADLWGMYVGIKAWLSQ